TFKSRDQSRANSRIIPGLIFLQTKRSSTILTWILRLNMTTRTTRAQAKLNFPVRKTRNSSRLQKNEENIEAPAQKLFDESLNVKPSKSSRRRKTCTDQENNTKATQQDVLPTPPPTPIIKHTILSVKPKTKTPQKEYIETPKTSQPLMSVRPCMSPPLSPRKSHLDNIQSPQKALLSPKRKTPSKSGDITPSKRRKENCPTPVKDSPKSTIPTSRVLFGLPDDRPNTPQLQTLKSQTPYSMCQTPRNLTPLRLAKRESQCYSAIKQNLHTATPTTLVGRQRERTEIETFLTQNLSNKQGNSLYISGAPGTGKTALLTKIMGEVKECKKCKTVYLNCMTLTNSRAIYSSLLGELTNGKNTSGSNKDMVRQVEKILTSSGQMILLILDEIDQLDSKNQEILYTMFEWPSLKKSRCLLIGIANALDLTDRILPRLQARPNCKPRLLNFSPYSKDEIIAILEDRLKKSNVDGQEIMDSKAVQFCARKVAAVAGDMRKALDICRRAVETVEAEVRSQTVLATRASPRKSPKKSVPKKITIAHIARVVSEVYGSKVVATPTQQTIPLQQKVLVCTLLLMLKNGKAKEIILGKLHEQYCKICSKRNMTGTDQSEFLSLCGLVESRGIIGIKKGKDTRLTKISLKLDEKELEFALQDKTLVTSIMNEGIIR
ncbi:unnamed protein product, partial [Owenia fusiformis]